MLAVEICLSCRSIQYIYMQDFFNFVFTWHISVLAVEIYLSYLDKLYFVFNHKLSRSILLHAKWSDYTPSDIMVVCERKAIVTEHSLPYLTTKPKPSLENSENSQTWWKILWRNYNGTQRCLQKHIIIKHTRMRSHVRTLARTDVHARVMRTRARAHTHTHTHTLSL